MRSEQWIHTRGSYRKIPKISPVAYIFQRPFLRGLFLGGFYSERLIYGRKLRFKIGYAYSGREMSLRIGICVSKSRWLVYSWKEIYVSNSPFQWLSHASTLSIWIEEIEAKTEDRTRHTAIYCDTFWLQSFGIRNSSLANAKIYVLLYSFCFVLFWIWG